MRIAIVGCGYVGDYYVKTLSNYPELELIGVMDMDQDRANRFATYHSLSCYGTMEELIEDPRVDIVVNLTNPKSHYPVSKACLEAGKHVYSEKPFALELSQAKELVLIAEKRGLIISSAPCTLLGETAQTVWKALRENEIGQIYVVYAELDNGLLHRKPFKKWISESGIPWPYKDEFEVGCTLEHADYMVSWLTAFFGPALSVTAFSSCLIPDKHTDVPLEVISPDFSVATIKFKSGVVARLTCSIIAPHNHSLQIVGDDGILNVKDCWDEWSPVYIGRRLTIRRRTLEALWKRKYPLVGSKRRNLNYRGGQKIDFSRGIAELARAIERSDTCRLSARFCLHNNEIVLAIQNASETGSPYFVTTSFDPIAPMLWAD